jgi:hypothetical protein
MMAVPELRRELRKVRVVKEHYGEVLQGATMLHAALASQQSTDTQLELISLLKRFGEAYFEIPDNAGRVAGTAILGRRRINARLRAALSSANFELDTKTFVSANKRKASGEDLNTPAKRGRPDSPDKSGDRPHGPKEPAEVQEAPCPDLEPLDDASLETPQKPLQERPLMEEPLAPRESPSPAQRSWAALQAAFPDDLQGMDVADFRGHNTIEDVEALFVDNKTTLKQKMMLRKLFASGDI